MSKRLRRAAMQRVPLLFAMFTGLISIIDLHLRKNTLRDQRTYPHMKVSATREHLLEALQSVIGVVDRRQTMPILSNVLLGARDNRLRVTGTDLEVELVAAAEVSVQQAGDITVAGRKLLDIVRTLPEKTTVTLTREGEKVVLRGGRTRFSLSSLSAREFSGRV